MLRSDLVVAEELSNLRLRVAWGGGAARSWSGTISVSEGTITSVRSLGIEPDQPGSIWLDGGRVFVSPRTPRSYDGIDVSVAAAKDARLRIDLRDDQSTDATPAARKQLEIPISKLVNELHNAALDDRGNWLLARRTPGDQLRVTLEPSQTILRPKQRTAITVSPHMLPAKPGTSVRLTATWVRGRHGEEVSSQTKDLSVDAGGAVPPARLEFVAPAAEGVYTANIVASYRPTLGWRQTLATRSIQVVVLDSNAALVAPLPRMKTTARDVVEIDRANPKWWDRLTDLSRVPAIPGIQPGSLPKIRSPRIPGIAQRPLGSGDVSKRSHTAGTFSALAPGGWEAYPIAGCEPGKPHTLTVEYPADVPQQLAISLVEPNAAGAVVPLGLDSGVYVEPGLRSAASGVVKHRVVFWPRTKQPYVLLAARDPKRPAVFGKIRVRMVGDRLTWLKDQPSRTERILAAYYNRPLVTENFSADETLDKWSGRSIDDWQTFYKGGTRLIEYLGHAGYNTLMLAVNSEGGAIYPSQLLEPTPKYDTGVFSSSGQDPQQKDVLGLFFEMFDRQQMRLIPVVQFGAPLPAMERALRRSGRDTVGIEWVGSDGRTWLEANPTRRKLGVYYNVLNPRVQEAMLAVVDEIIARYEGHPSYAGLAVELSAFGYAQLPGVKWGFDDNTIEHFSSDTGTEVPGSGAERFAVRARFLLSDAQRANWIKWRADRLGMFHREIARRVTSRRTDAKLFLTGTDTLADDNVQARLRPALPSRRGVADELARVGIIPATYGRDPKIVMLRPYPISLPRSPVVDAADQRIRDWAVTESSESGGEAAAALFYHRPSQTYLTGLAEQGPWGKEKTKPWIVSQMSPSAVENRRRFVRMLAGGDVQTMVDGGWMLNLGQEASLADLLRVYRSLPAAPFETVRGESDPVTVRTLASADETLAYLVNDSPWEVTTTLTVGAPAGCRVESLIRTRDVPELVAGRDWVIKLKPYDLIGVRFDAPNVSLGSARTTTAPEVKKILRERIDELTRRTAALRWPAAFEALKNADFEDSSGARINAWQSTGVGATSLRVDDRTTHHGKQSAVMLSRGPVLSLRSDAMRPPESGRVSVSVWLRVADANRQPPLRLAIEGKHRGRAYYRYASVGAGRGSVPIKNQWNQFIFQVDDLPVDELSDLRVRFDLMGSGEVWVDHVELYPLAFSDHERVELSKVVSLAGIQLEKGKVGQCTRVLEGHWAKFLVTHAPLDAARTDSADVARREEPKADEKPPERTPEKTGFLDRVRGALPF